jgi:hypothetical protein
MERAYRLIDGVDVGPRFFSGRYPIRFYLRVDSPETEASQIKAGALFLCLSCPGAFDGRNASTVAESRLSLFAMPRHRRRWK